MGLPQGQNHQLVCGLQPPPIGFVYEPYEDKAGSRVFRIGICFLRLNSQHAAKDNGGKIFLRTEIALSIGHEID